MWLSGPPPLSFFVSPVSFRLSGQTITLHIDRAGTGITRPTVKPASGLLDGCAFVWPHEAAKLARPPPSRPHDKPILDSTISCAAAPQKIATKNPKYPHFTLILR